MDSAHSAASNIPGRPGPLKWVRSRLPLRRVMSFPQAATFQIIPQGVAATGADWAGAGKTVSFLDVLCLSPEQPHRVAPTQEQSELRRRRSLAHPLFVIFLERWHHFGLE